MSLILCLFEMSKYIQAEYLFFESKRKKYWSFIAGFCIYAFFFFCTDISLELNHFVIYVITIIASYCSMQGSVKKKLLRICILFFIMTAISGFVQFLYDLFFSERIDQNYVGIMYMLRDIMSIIFLSIGILIKKKSKNRFQWAIEFCKDNAVMIMIFTAVIISFAISMLSYSKNMIDNELFSIMAVVISGIAYLSIGMLGGMAIYIKILNDKNNELMENEVLLKDMQKKYYEALLEQEKETRSYRHDMSNHLVCLSSLAAKGNLETLTNYLNEMRGEMIRIKGRQYKTGNEILDIMTNFYVPQLSNKIHVTLSSNAEVKLDEMKICTIYANLLQNAVEELNSDPDREGKLNIVFKCTDQTFKMMLENSIFRKREDSKRLITQKNDKRNHGIGLANVTSTVENLGGKVFINNDTEMFRIVVELNI